MSKREGAEDDKGHHDGRNFTIKDNILIGEELSIPREAVNAGEVLLRALKSKPDCICQVDALTGEKNTYGEIGERSVKCALWLKKQGVKPGDIIGICTDNNLNAILPLLASMYVGSICNTWDHKLSPITARYFLSLTSPTLIFAIASSAGCLMETAKELKMNVKIVTFEKLDGYESFEDVLQGHDNRQVAEFKCATISKPDEVALIVPSSGSTGLPKGTEISHFSIYACMHPARVTHMAGEICTWLATIRWHYGIMMALQTIAGHGTRIVIPDYDDDQAIFECVEKYQVTYFSCDTYLLIRFVKNEMLKKFRFPNLKMIANTGAHFRKHYQEAMAKQLPHIFVTNEYGMTDAGGLCSAQTKDSKLGSIGFVSIVVQIKISDLKTGKTLGSNQQGELCIKVPNVMNGYYKNPEATKQAFDSDGWLRTGDVGYYDNDGELFLLDRISEFINFRCINVSPAEIETILGNHPAVFQVAVIAIPDEVDEQLPMAIISRVQGQMVTEKELIDFVEKNMPDHCRLRGGVKFMDKLPCTATGKISKTELRKIFIN